MAKKTDKSETKKPEADPQAVPKALVAVGEQGCIPQTIDELWRFGAMISRSTMIPERYQNNEGNCAIAVELSMRWGVPWLAVMQHVYMVHGIPAMDSTLATALTNRSGVFLDPIDFEAEGTDAKADDFRVRAFAVRKSTGKKLYGPWIDWALVSGEGWNKKDGSKWLTMPDQMFHYRAASWFQRRYCPEVTMGMLTPDEVEDMPKRKRVEARTVEPGIEGVKERIKAQQEAAAAPGPEPQEAETPEPADPDERDEQTQARIDAEKAKLAAAEESPTEEAETVAAGTGEGGSNLF